MPKITLDEFCAHWVEGKYVTKMPNKLQYNVFDFVTLAGDYSRQQFQASFSSGGFCGGSHWAPRTSRWGKRFTHPVMNDSGTLARSINFENKRTNIVGRRNNRTRIFSKGAYYNIYTTEKSVPVRGKRGRSRERYGHYAAVHNTDPKFGLFTAPRTSSVHRFHSED